MVEVFGFRKLLVYTDETSLLGWGNHASQSQDEKGIYIFKTSVLYIKWHISKKELKVAHPSVVYNNTQSPNYLYLQFFKTFKV